MAGNVFVKTLQNVTEVFSDYERNRPVFQEALEIIKNYIGFGEFSLFIYEMGELRLLATSISDSDEIDCLSRHVRNTGAQGIQKSHMEQTRKGIKDALRYPLVFQKHIMGYLIHEIAEGEIASNSEFDFLFQQLGLQAILYMQDRECRRNLYRDCLTGMPGREYFLQYIRKRKQEGESIWICAIRIAEYCSLLQENGTGKWNQMVKDICSMICAIYHNTVYRVSEDTFTVILDGEMIEIYETALAIQNGLEKICTAKYLLMDVFLTSDFMMTAENEFEKCRNGSIFMPSIDSNRPLLAFFQEPEDEPEKKDIEPFARWGFDFDLFERI